MTKYATQRKYQPYIDVIMDDLGLTGKVHIDWKFRNYKSMGGDAYLFTTKFDGVRYGEVRISNEVIHEDLILTLMHELRHIHQRLHNRLKDGPEDKMEWDGKLYSSVRLKRNGKATKEYMLQPWEVDADNYEKEVERLFPNLEIQTRQYIGAIGKTKFYKIKG